MTTSQLINLLVLLFLLLATAATAFPMATRSSTRRLATTTLAAQQQPPSKRVAVLGAGAAGLVAGRLLRDAGCHVQIFEKSDVVGGVWKYRPKDVVYKSLVTNLPKEIMAYHDTPFDASLPSFLGHAQVQTYLEQYTQAHQLQDLISFRTEVTAVRPLQGDDARPWPPGDYTVFAEKEEEEGEEEEPRWRVTTTQSDEVYDAVVVCNGHFDVPFAPPLPGLAEHYKGRVVHSREYDDPSALRGLKVLCLGYKSSGTDIAREVATVAKEVHVVDRRLSPNNEEKKEEDVRLGNVFRRPALVGFLEDGRSVAFADGTVCEGVDVVLLCTGYCYSMPFLSGGGTPGDAPVDPKKDARLLRIEDRAVHPIYQHLFHATFPSLTFLGLLHSVVPFPLFELQAKWVVRHLLGQTALPSRAQRYAWLEEEERRQRAEGRLSRDWHYMGGGQWAYKRLLAREGECLTHALEQDLVVRQGIYDDVSMRRPVFPGGSDSYRKCEYRVAEGGKGWTVDDSLQEKEGKADGRHHNTFENEQRTEKDEKL